ncbi:MAG: hypothetical protein F4Y12_06545 [Acidimicrobiaceae bacterium]|nr:hypothetical protein [Acidimicrobiaceae bacterium]
MPVKGVTHPAMVDVADQMDRFVRAYIPVAGYDAARPDSPSEAERQANLPRSVMPDVDESVLCYARRSVMWRTFAGLDCFEGLASCIRNVTSVLAVYPMARTAMEGFAAAAWLLEPDIGTELRAHRGILDYRESLTAPIHTLRMRAKSSDHYDPEAPASYASHLRRYENELKFLQRDLKAVRRLLPDATSLQHPGLTRLVDDSLTDATEPGVGVGAYSHLCEIVHPGADSTKRLVNSGSTRDFLNVNLSWWVTPLLATGWLMEHCLTRRAAYYGLPSPELHLQPVLDALYAASSLPSDTLLLVPPLDTRL